jgi:hypothetical protein
MTYTFWGGPQDGATVPKQLLKQELVVLSSGKANNNSVIYYYVRCEEHLAYEYHGDDTEGYDYD